MGRKTGTAQVRKIEGAQRGQSGAWKFRDHGLFICFAPVEQPRYAAAVVIEHGLGGARAAAPVAKDFLTYLYDPKRPWPRSWRWKRNGAAISMHAWRRNGPNGKQRTRACRQPFPTSSCRNGKQCPGRRQ